MNCTNWRAAARHACLSCLRVCSEHCLALLADAARRCQAVLLIRSAQLVTAGVNSPPGADHGRHLSNSPVDDGFRQARIIGSSLCGFDAVQHGGEHHGQGNELRPLIRTLIRTP